MLPEKFDDQFIRLICKSNNEDKLDNLKSAFEQWCNKKEYPIPRVGYFKIRNFREKLT